MEMAKITVCYCKSPRGWVVDKLYAMGGYVDASVFFKYKKDAIDFAKGIKGRDVTIVVYDTKDVMQKIIL